jgi:acetate kinase
MARAALLVINAGSTSLKFGLRGVAADSGWLLRGHYALRGRALALDVARPSSRQSPAVPVTAGEPARIDEALTHLLEWLPAELASLDLDVIGVGHRIVHGGQHFTAPVLFGREVLAELEALIPMAPLHQPLGLAAIRALLEARPDWSQVACFDTTFHATQPLDTRLYGLPRQLADRGYIRYGFHGLACEAVMATLAAESTPLAAGRVLLMHLGGGASLTGVVDGRSVHHSMGWSALDGLVMSTRSGSLDPGLVLALVREYGDPGLVESLLYRRSGLLGLSGLSSDLRDLLASDAPEAQRAVDVYVRRIVLEAGAAIAAMGGVDALAFSGGVGENAVIIRRRVCAALNWIGVQLDAEANERHASKLEVPGSRVGIRRVVADEEAVIGAATMRVLGLGA